MSDHIRGTLIKLHAEQQAHTQGGKIVGTYADCTTTTWGFFTSTRGARHIITRQSKRLGLRKSTDGLSAHWVGEPQ